MSPTPQMLCPRKESVMSKIKGAPRLTHLGRTNGWHGHAQRAHEQHFILPPAPTAALAAALKPRNRSVSTWLLVAFSLLLPNTSSWSASSAESTAKLMVFHDLRKQTAEFIGYSKSIVLTPEQDRIKAEALESIPAPCCEQYSIATCCCPCNLAKSVWGLANYLIAKGHQGPAQVQQAVVRWLESTNGQKYTGDACFTGGCNRPFQHNGCGGMKETDVLF